MNAARSLHAHTNVDANWRSRPTLWTSCHYYALLPKVPDHHIGLQLLLVGEVGVPHNCYAICIRDVAIPGIHVRVIVLLAMFVEDLALLVHGRLHLIDGCKA